MKKVILLLMISLFGMAAMAQSSVYMYKTDGTVVPYKIATVDSISFTSPDVLINGVYWASRNVAAPGTFAASPEDAGYFYQWNNKEGWPATGAIGSIIATNGTTTWNSSWNGGFITASASDTWATSRDPSPAGYRVPTYAELQTLGDATKVTKAWTTQNSVSGYKFTDRASGNSIFLPASGCRDGSDGTLFGAGLGGYYWNNLAFYASYAYCLGFNSSFDNWNANGRAAGFAVRPVAE